MPSRTAELQACRVRLASEPAAAAEARSQVRAAIAAWNAPVDQDVAVLLAGELVTNAIQHAAGESVMLGIRCTRDRLRVDVHDRSSSPPVLANAPAEAEGGRGLMLVASLSAEWGYYRIPMGKIVYFTLAFDPDLTGGSDMTSDGETPRPGPPGEDPGRPGLSWRRDQPCRRCGGVGTHYLTCPLLQAPVNGEPPGEGEQPR
jgi:anti-sigma regulatory factor (Ser/Thr protein kinase)